MFFVVQKLDNISHCKVFYLEISVKVDARIVVVDAGDERRNFPRRRRRRVDNFQRHGRRVDAVGGQRRVFRRLGDGGAEDDPRQDGRQRVARQTKGHPPQEHLLAVLWQNKS